MPTVIDSLVVELSLDPRNFSEGQRRAVDSLRRMERAVTTGGQQVTRQVNDGIARTFRAIEHPFVALRSRFEQLTMVTAAKQPLRRNLADLAAEGRRSGLGIEAGATAGAAGLRVLGTAGLAATAAITALNKTMAAATQSAANVFGTAVGAGAAGMPISQFSAIAQALFTHGNVPQEQTQNWLARMKQFQELAKTGNVDEGMILRLAQTQAGIDAFGDTPEQMMIKLARTFSHLTSEQAVARGGLAGLTLEQSLALRAAGPRLPGYVGEEQRRAVTEHQSSTAQDLLEAQNKLSVSWNNLTRILFDELDPALTAFYNIVSKIVDKLAEQGGPAVVATGAVAGGGALYLLRKAWRALFGGGNTAAVAKAAEEAAAEAAPSFLKGLIGGLLKWIGGPIAAYFGMGTGNIPADENKLPGADPRVGPYFRSHMRPQSSSSPSSSTPASSSSVDVAFARSNLPPEAQAFMRDIASGEAVSFDQLAHHGPGSANAYPDKPGYAGFPDWPGTPNPPWGTSHGAGLFQDEQGTWKSIAQGTGLTNFRDPQHQIQGNWWWAQKTYRDASGRDLLTDLKAGNLDPRGRRALGTQWARGAIAGGLRYQAFLERSRRSSVPSGPSSTDAIRQANAERERIASAGPSNTTNDVSVGDIHVHTMATDARAIAKDIGAELRNTIRANQANAGLTP